MMRSGSETQRELISLSPSAAGRSRAESWRWLVSTGAIPLTVFLQSATPIINSAYM